MTRILIIDDEAVFREDMATLLRQEGYDCATAENGETGLTTAEQFQPQIVLCDLVMPGMSGPELVQHLRSRRQLTKALCISGNRDKAFTSGLQADMAFLQKPFSPAVLALKVRELLDASPQERE